MYATFEEFLEHQQQQPSDLDRPPSPQFSPSTPPPPPAPSHQTPAPVRKKMSNRVRRRRAHVASGGGSSGGSGSRDDVSSSGGGGGASDTPLVATIRSIQDGRRGASGGSGGDSEEHYLPPGPAPSCRNYSPHLLSPAPPMGSLHAPSTSVDALSCGGYAGTNSIDSGYKSACPTPDLSDSLYPDTFFLRGSTGGLTSPRPRITMGTRVMSRSMRGGSDPAYYEDFEPSSSPRHFHRRPSTSPGPRSGGSTSGSCRPRSASTGSRSSPATLGSSSRRTLRNSPHLSSTGSLTSSILPYSRHSSPGGAISSGHHESPQTVAQEEASSASQLALLEREIDALLTGTSMDSDGTPFPSSEGSHEVSPSLGSSQRTMQAFSGPEDVSPSRPPHVPTRLRGEPSFLWQRI